MSIDLKTYEVVRFSTKTTNRTVTRTGYKVGTFLVVGWSDEMHKAWRIYRSQDGLECIGTTFQTSKDAIQFAEWIDKTYRNEEGESYFFVWSEYPHAELFRWTHLTIENGEKYWKALSEIRNMRNTTWEDVQRILS
ncbi:MAG: hypothetical protein ACW98F_08220 [Candidatus Hodarchaeales archaeon]|jgi:hypothetical protein